MRRRRRRRSRSPITSIVKSSRRSRRSPSTTIVKSSRRSRRSTSGTTPSTTTLALPAPPSSGSSSGNERCPARSTTVPSCSGMSSTEKRNTYKNFIRKLHPDKNKDCQNLAKEKFQKLKNNCT